MCCCCCCCRQVRDPAKGTVYIVAEARLAALPGAVPKAKKGGDKKKGGPADGKEAAAAPAGFELLAKFTGAELVGGLAAAAAAATTASLM